LGSTIDGGAPVDASVSLDAADCFAREPGTCERDRFEPGDAGIVPDLSDLVYACGNRPNLTTCSEQIQYTVDERGCITEMATLDPALGRGMQCMAELVAGYRWPCAPPGSRRHRGFCTLEK
jgi:hypothetical protein